MPPRLKGAKVVLLVATLTTVIVITCVYKELFARRRVLHRDAGVTLDAADIAPYRHMAKQHVGRDQWRAVPGSKDKFFVFSAFFERRGVFHVRVIGATNTANVETAWCVLWYADTPAISVRAVIQIIHEHHDMPYSACFIMCPLGSAYPVPQQVAVVGDLSLPPTHRLPVVDNDPAKLDRPGQFAACVKPLYNYSDVLELIEFCELYQLLGVDHVVLYENSTSPQVRCAMASYEASGDMTVIPWHLDLVSDRDIRTEGIFAALNDCLYRHMYRYRHVIVVDLDEFIVPRSHASLVELVEHLDQENDARKDVGAYVFKNSFFYLDWKQPESAVDVSDPWVSSLHSTGKLLRKLQLEDYTIRSKYIAKTERVVELGNHFVWEHMPGVDTVNVAPALATSQHYRQCDVVDCTKQASKLDKTALRFKGKLLNRVMDRWEALKEKCEFPDIVDIAKERWVL